jgi:hypothetical protein
MEVASFQIKRFQYALAFLILASVLFFHTYSSEFEPKFNELLDNGKIDLALICPFPYATGWQTYAIKL